MLRCKQTKNQSVYLHGQSVASYYKDLVQLIEEGHSHCEWRIPKWLKEYGKQLINDSHSKDLVNEYLIFHDCGKPFCHVVDEDGRSHFPDHANVSKKTYLAISDRCDKIKVANLIGWDMLIHTASADEVGYYCENVWTKKDAFTLVLASISELHSNAIMFGGIESINFKSKWKKIDRRGKQICKHFLKEY